jgi:hypothetical protein
MAFAVIRQPLTAESQVRSRAVHVRFVKDKVALGQVLVIQRQYNFNLSFYCLLSQFSKL